MPRVVHFEIPGDNPDRLAQFYSEVFGWQINKWGGPVEYWLVTTGPEGQRGINGGLMRRPPSGPGATTVNTIEVPSIDEYMKTVEANGGKLATPKTPIPGIGYFCYCQDPEGNYFGIMQPDTAAH